MGHQGWAIARATVAFLVTIIALGGAVGGLIFSSQSITHTVTITSIRTTTMIAVSYVTQSDSQTNSNALCIVTVPPPQGIYLRLTEDSGSPIAGLHVTVQSTPSASCDSKDVHLTNSLKVTNSSGWIVFQGWLYYFVFTHSGGTYNFTVPSSPMAWTIATISVPSGTLTTEICGLGGGGPHSSCSTWTTTSVTRTLGP